MAWLLLLLAGLCDAVWMALLKAQPFGKNLTLLVAIPIAFGTVFAINTALKTLPLGSCYAVWIGSAALFITLINLLLFHERYAPMQLLCIALILGGVVGLHFFSRSA